MIYWLVVLTILKNMSSSVGMLIPNIWKVIKLMFQTTNQMFIGNSSINKGPFIGYRILVGYTDDI